MIREKLRHIQDIDLKRSRDATHNVTRKFWLLIFTNTFDVLNKKNVFLRENFVNKK